MKRTNFFSLIKKDMGKRYAFAAAATRALMILLLLTMIKTHNLYTPFRTDTLLLHCLLLLFYALGRTKIQRRRKRKRRTVSSAFGWLRCAPQISSFFLFEQKQHSSSISSLLLQTSRRRRSNSWSMMMMSMRFASFRTKKDACYCVCMRGV